MRSPIAVYPALFAAAYVMGDWASAAIVFEPAVRPLLVALLGALVLTAIATALLRDRDRGGVLALILVATLIAGSDPRVAILVVVIVILLIVERISTRTRPSAIPWPRVHAALSVFGVVLLVAATVPGIVTWFSTPTPAPIAGESVTSGERPDIYIVLLDGHGRADTLASGFDYDATPFIDALEGDGFTVATRNRSNYMTTRLTLSSMLNARWVPELSGDELGTPEAQRTISRAIADNRIIAIVRAAGYETFAIPSGFDQAIIGADHTPGSPWMSEFEFALLHGTLLGQMVDRLAPQLAADQDRGRVEESFALIPGLAARDGDPPRLAFVHVAVPHWPYVFEADGSPRQTQETIVAVDEPMERTAESRAAEAEAYAAQVTHTDRLATDAVHGLMTAISRPSVVIVFSDHGPDVHIDWTDLQGTDPTERFTNLFAAATPGATGLFPDDVSPIDILPLVLDRYLGTDLPTHGPHTFLGAGSSVGGADPSLVETPNPDALGP